MRPIFFAPTDIQPGPLSDEITTRLKDSRHLIVVCSPNSAQSEWVGKEIEYFHSLGRSSSNIHFFIVKGTPHSDDPANECFHPIINKLGLPEILASNIHEKAHAWPWLNRERAYVQLISKLLGVEFDTIWQRHKRSLVRNATAWIVGGFAFIASLLSVWHENQPFDLKIRLNESSVCNNHLPPLQNAQITVQLDNETKTGILTTSDSCMVFTNIPHRFLDKDVRFKVTCPNFIDVDTTIGLSHNVILDLHRNDSVFGNVSFRLYDYDSEEYLSGISLVVDNQEAITDSEGRVEFKIPMERQRPYYLVSCSLSLINDTIFMPCIKSSVIYAK